MLMIVPGKPKKTAAPFGLSRAIRRPIGCIALLKPKGGAAV